MTIGSTKTIASTKRFLRAAVAENGQEVSAGGSPLRRRAALGSTSPTGFTKANAIRNVAKQKRRRRSKTEVGRAAKGVARNSTSITVDDLVTAKKLVCQVGSIETVRQALAALARLS